jgi:hypothetical protein
LIEYARGIPTGEIRALWKQCFNDPDRFYTSTSPRIPSRKPLVRGEGGGKSSLQMMPYR